MSARCARLSSRSGRARQSRPGPSGAPSSRARVRVPPAASTRRRRRGVRAQRRGCTRGDALYELALSLRAEEVFRGRARTTARRSVSSTRCRCPRYRTYRRAEPSGARPSAGLRKNSRLRHAAPGIVLREVEDDRAGRRSSSSASGCTERRRVGCRQGRSAGVVQMLPSSSSLRQTTKLDAGPDPVTDFLYVSETVNGAAIAARVDVHDRAAHGGGATCCTRSAGSGLKPIPRLALAGGAWRRPGSRDCPSCPASGTDPRPRVCRACRRRRSSCSSS